MKLTPTQRTLLLEGVRPGMFTFGSGGGIVVADPRTIRALIAKKLAYRPMKTLHYDWRCKAILTRAGFEAVGATPPEKDYCDPTKPWR